MSTPSSMGDVVCFGGADHDITLRALSDVATERGVRFARHAAEHPHPDQVFDAHAAAGWRPSLVVFGAGRWQPGSALNTSPDEWDAAWRSLCLPGARVGQAAIRHLLGQGGGTLVFLGHADGFTDGQPARQARSAPFGAAHAAASAGLRALAQSMARGFGPQGVHVAHLLIDANGPAPADAARAIAQACCALHAQPRSAWTHEMDLRHRPTA